jgi:hypothetical protein
MPADEIEDANRGQERAPVEPKWDFNIENNPDGADVVRDHKDGTASRTSLREDGTESTGETMNTDVGHSPKPDNNKKPDPDE